MTNTETKSLKTRAGEILLSYREIIIHTLFAFFISRLSVTGGISPFAPAFLLATGNKLPVLLSSVLGMLSSADINNSKYILSLIFSGTVYTFINLAFPKTDLKKASPFILSFSSFIFGMIFVYFTDYVVFDILLVILESFLSPVFFLVVNNSLHLTGREKKRFFTNAELSAPLVMLTVIIAGIGNFNLPWGIQLKNIICIYFILCASSSCSMGTLAQVSVFMGIASGLGNDYFPLYISAFSIASLFCSVFATSGKIFATLGFISGNIIITALLSENRYMVMSFSDIGIASALYFLTPPALLGKLNRIFCENTVNENAAETVKRIATVKLDRLSYAFSKLASSLREAGSKTDIPTNISAIYESVSDKICKKCTMRFYCWQKDYSLTTDAFTKITDRLKENGRATVKDFPDYFTHKCIKANDVLMSLVSGYEIFRLNTVWENKMKENARLYREQFNELSHIVRNLKKEIDENPCFDTELSGRLSVKLEESGINVIKVNVIKDCNDSYQADITLVPCHGRGNKCYDEICSILKEVLGASFYKSHGKCSFKECHLYFKECEIYTLDSAVRQSTKLCSEKNGDSWAIKTLENGSRYIALCDGSGSGEQASKYSGSTIKLLEEFLKTGFSKDSSVKLISSSFLNSGEQDFSSTIDLGIIDMKNGDFEIIKKGAAPTYIMRADGEFEIIKSNTLPMGIFNGEKGKLKKTFLCENDIIVMASDGVTDSVPGEDWIIDALCAINSREPEYIAEMILKISQTADKAGGDDKTVIVSKMKKQA